MAISAKRVNLVSIELVKESSLLYGPRQCASVGAANQSIAVPRDILKPILLSNGNRMIVSHNYPSGDTAPSKQDKEFTKRL